MDPHKLVQKMKLYFQMNLCWNDTYKRKVKQRWFDFFHCIEWLVRKKKLTYGIRETRITGEVADIPRMTIQPWIEPLLELTASYELNIIWECGLFLRPCQKRALFKNREVEKAVKCLSNILQQHSLWQLMAPKWQSQLLFRKANHQDVLRTHRTKLKLSIVHYFLSNKALIRMDNFLTKNYA